MDAHPYLAEQVGAEALAKIGYIPLLHLARQAGWVTTKVLQRSARKAGALLAMGPAGAAAATGFIEVFSKYAVAAGVTSQVDSPLPGPGDVVAIGIVVIGLIDAGLLAGELLDSLGDVASPALSTTAAAPPAVTKAPAAPTSTAAPVPTVASTSSDETPEEKQERCRQVLEDCIVACRATLPTYEWSGDKFFRCKRNCLRSAGCP